MKFTIIDPKARAIRDVEHEELAGALVDAGLKIGEVDHGVMGEIDGVGVAYVADEYALCEPVTSQSYFAIGKALFAGPIVVYGFARSGDGETVDVPKLPDNPAVRWIDDPIAAATLGQIELPETSVTVDGVKTVLWRFGQGRPTMTVADVLAR